MYFAKLNDSPMFRQQLQCMEEGSESLRSRCWKFYKGCRKYTEGLGEAYDGDIAFASALENFGGGHSDPLFVTLGGPVMTKFTIALREISTHKELLRSQVEHMLNDRLLNILNVEILDVKEARRRFDKASLVYDQAREKFMSLRKSTKFDVAAVIEEELHNARDSFEEARFNLVSALHNVEAKKRFEFLEAVTGVMDAHLRYFQQGYQLLQELEPFIVEVLAYAQKARETYNEEQISLCEKMVEYKKLVHQESRLSLNGPYGSPVEGAQMQPFSRISNKVVDAVTESAANGKVRIIRQGYLSKRSSNLRGDWKRRYFILDSRGMLYYYRKPWNGFTVNSCNQPPSQRHCANENSAGILSRLLSSQYHGVIPDEKSVARHTVNLLTSTIKADAEQSDLRFCFRIISPAKIYTLQAENALDQMDWMEKINGVIASLLTVQTLQYLSADSESGDSESACKIDYLSQSSQDDDRLLSVDFGSRNITSNRSSSEDLQKNRQSLKVEKPIEVLRKVSGNDKCADCGKPDPDWASLNLGILVCIECSGVHRNLGVHISKVRSLTLDVKVWDSSVLTMFQSLGNLFANSVWEELLNSTTASQTDDTFDGSSIADTNKLFLTKKPEHDDPISLKEKFIHAKYAEKVFVRRMTKSHHLLSVAQVWESICANDKKAVYRHIVKSDMDVNAISGEALLSGAGSLSNMPSSSSNSNISSKGKTQLMEDIQDGSSMLHLACLSNDAGMIELLLQYGAHVNAIDSSGRTPLHHCIMRGKNATAKLLITRGANPLAMDKEGNTPLMLASEPGTIGKDILALVTSR